MNEKQLDGFIKAKVDTTIKYLIGSSLFDKNNPEMVTNLTGDDINRIAALKIFVHAENLYRERNNYDKNIFGDVINEHLVLRTSLNGWRANQGENILKGGVMREAEIKKTLFDRLFRGGGQNERDN